MTLTALLLLLLPALASAQPGIPTLPGAAELTEQAEQLRKRTRQPWTVLADSLRARHPLDGHGHWTATLALPPAPDGRQRLRLYLGADSVSLHTPHVSEALGGRRYEYVDLNPTLTLDARGDSLRLTWRLDALDVLLDPDLRTRRRETRPLEQCHPWAASHGLRKVAEAKAAVAAHILQERIFEHAKQLLTTQ